MNRERQHLFFIHFLFAGSHQFSTTAVTFSRQPENAPGKSHPNFCANMDPLGISATCSSKRLLSDHQPSRHRTGVSVVLGPSGRAEPGLAHVQNRLLLAERATDAGVARGPIEEERLSAHYVLCNGTEVGDAAVEAIWEIVSDNEERAFRHGRRLEHGVVSRIPLAKR
jgi:hypothetical protein